MLLMVEREVRGGICQYVTLIDMPQLIINI